LSDNFPSQNGLKQGDALSPLLFNFALKYASWKVRENQVGLKLNGTHQLLIYADDVNLLGDSIHTVKKNTETLIDASKEVSLEVNTEVLTMVYGGIIRVVDFVHYSNETLKKRTLRKHPASEMMCS
jgi:hypothetical protein